MDRVTVTADELPSVVTTRVIAALRKERAQMSPVSVGTSRAGRRALWSIRTNELDHTHRHQAPGPEDRLLEKELVGAVWRALAELGPLDQVLVVERYGLQGLAPARMVDIAAKHHLTIAAATKRLQRSLARLGGLLEPWAPDPGASSPLTCPWVPRPEEMAEARRRVAARLATAFIETQPPPDTLPSNRWYRKHIRPSHAELVQDIEQLLSAA
jgi:DNA-directed RNA polymerase specialized sigma24 family protein